MTLEQLRVFVAVAERLHMTRAAEALNLTQSAASAAVAALEARHGVRLFDRVGRGLVLSPEGRAFLPEAQAVLARAAAAAQVLDDLAGLRRGAVAIYASQTIASYWLPPRLVRFRQAHPAVEVRLSVGNTAQVAAAVAAGEVDLGFVEGPVEDATLERTRVGADRLAVVVGVDHPWAAGAAIAPAELAKGPWVLREPGSGTRSEFEQALRRRGLDPAGIEVAAELPSNEAVLAAVRAGGLAAAVSELAAEPMLGAGVLRRAAFEFPERAFELLRHPQRHRSRAAEALIGTLG
ncbi:LysR substrate-binding domain-containing protein [Caulobacter sp. 17J80-11]|uniref:LysR substrate-binding domain-containing protein n=1 Tax=Caulobacter sp. 17J80-11 TaxID=2763502 RepID=UPI0016538CCA|nr:LysR substrate-binding domain-containing protein [Caulobacter sp. 17J80-11]MBC6980971.1 LysR family transcriptional regulator [Caulobacter sp. 17J80-11]